MGKKELLKKIEDIIKNGRSNCYECGQRVDDIYDLPYIMEDISKLLDAI